MSTKKNKPQITSPIVWALAVSLAVLAGLFFLKMYLGVIILGLLLAFVFHPIYEKLNSKLHSSTASSAITTVISILFLLIPALLIIALTVSQTITLINTVSDNVTLAQDEGVKEILFRAADSTNKKIENIVGISEAIKQSDVQTFLNETLPNIAKSLANSIIDLLKGVPTLVTMLIIYLFVFTAGLTRGEKLVRLFKEISPFDKKTNDLYVSRVGAMAKAMIKGQLVIAAVQGTVSAGVLALLGFEEYFFFLAVLLTFLSFIPLGAGIITIPIGIALIAFGNILGGIVVLANHFLVITNIDNVIRPKLVPKEAELHPALLILSAFAGVYYFGFLGVIYGPIVMIILSTTIESYLAYKKRLS